MTTVDKSTKLYSTFDPRSISDCTLWLDANDSSTITRSGSNITNWRDKSSGGFNATNGSGSGPTTVTSNNLTYLSFNGTTNFLQTTLTIPGNTHSILIVYRPNANNASSNSLLRAQAGKYIVFPYYTGGLKNSYISNFETSPGTTIDAANSPLDPSASTSVHNVVAITIASGSQAIFNNGTSRATATAALDSGLSQAFYIGAFNGVSQFYAGQLAEVIIYTRSITATERQYLEGYLAWKWGLQGNLAVSHPYISRNPNLSPFRPTDITNCALWLDGADASTVTGTTNVTQWNDKSGNSRNFTATTGPSYSSNTMTFNGSTQRLGNTAWNNFSRINHTLIAVHRPDTNSAFVGNTRLFSIQQTAGNPYVVFPYLNNTTPNGYINDGNASTNPAASGKTLLDNSSTSAFNITTASIGSSSQVIYRNGTVQDSQTYTLSAGTITTGVNIGNQYSEWYKGSVREILIYTSALSVIDVNRIEGYLAWKWGLQGNLPSTHPFKNFYPLKIN
jgi:hypothetical protein